MLFGGGQLILDIMKKHMLAFNFPLSAIQGSCSTFPFPLLFNQFAFEFLITFFGHVEGIQCRYLSPLFFLQLSMGIIHHLFGLKCGLDGLEGKRSTIKKKKRKKRKKRLTMARSLFRPRKTLCCLMDLRSAMSLGSNRDCTTTSTTYPVVLYWKSRIEVSLRRGAPSNSMRRA